MKIGSLFSGYGGLDMGVQAVLGGDVAWHVEYDKAPSQILEHHWPTVPNYGDITTVDWSAVEPVDIITGGFPCQDLSLAGRRAGMRPGTRSGLWADYLKAIDTLRPKLAVIENVRGLLSGCAESDMESCPGCMGESDVHRPVLRALGRVLGDLASIGYDTERIGLRAADAGAPHGRFRVFVVAHPAGQPWRFGDGDDVRAGGGTDGLGSDAGRGSAEDANLAVGDQRRLAASEQAEGGRARTDAGGRGGALASDAASARRSDGQDVRSGRGHARTRAWRVESQRARSQRAIWGKYAPAIWNWQYVTGRNAPAPTRPDGRADGHRLSPEFVEWMMGLPKGHVTGVGLTREQELKALGNGVVPQQAALALSILLGTTSHSLPPKDATA